MSNSNNTSVVTVTLQTGGIAGETYCGYVTYQVQKPIFVRSGIIELRLETTGIKINSTPNLLPGNLNVEGFTTRSGSGTYDVISSYQLIGTFEIPGLLHSMSLELPPGTYEFPFSFILPHDLPPASYFGPKGLRARYVVDAILYTSEGPVQSRYVSCPVIFNLGGVPLSLPKTVSLVLKTTHITVSLPKQCFALGETITLNCSIKNLAGGKNDELLVELISYYSFFFGGFSNSILSYCVKSIDEPFQQQISFVIPMTTSPSFNNQSYSYSHYIRITNKSVNTSGHVEGEYIPITIFAPKPMSSQLIEENQASNVEKILVSPLDNLKPPRFPERCVNGFEKIRLEDGKVVYVDHFKRLVYENENGTPSQVPYPCYESELLPPGLTFGYYKNQRYIVDFCNKQTFFEFQRPIPCVSQASVNDCSNPVVSIHVIETIGMKTKKGKSPKTLLCAVIDNNGKLLKSKESKGVDQTYPKSSFILNPGIERRNVVIYFFEKKALKKDTIIGSVSFDLTKIKFGSHFDGWFDLKGSPFGNEYVCGRAHILFGYDRSEHNINGQWIHLNDFCSEILVPYYPNDDAMKKIIDQQNELRSKKGVSPIYDTSKGCVIPIKYADF
ncbi:hypothetical protein EHI8A_116630 [Entamoeba histolytica HM-1:IMSS-B]|uniref:Arrestin C-terminal-like domain-containing protein n=5 Tax=Entamoeba histolytica TaxID=5759 RepID=C4LS97_ENTH1|nr:hypothetical protein EHI_153050 [Entamoeba histolytica HM-1:IMSS]EMD42680.1 Hypothetical protein EHI5A_033780 [Entamoeba histolytica KU27]EMH75846.1 hypothetical protein EHI8A_116630 [Entamoeba histolytica HM-1:IMSS-B]ENY65613.1 hypothetical protein EHI7A_108270 [Entamoeba histolytica HM-1:IMSS-A]GAT91558.1 hypothetical protein CL6EHI_153050 [Entamoeba histolytica]EAL51024.1 hypothetical protein EHI_153050 [Entamoeba histolytica HM-1:IMSS]|eukprot:XP_656411.1 hypothetical protein EHI_153050 [Entamoeba histolytica HM-1:IMSS]